MCLYLKVSLYLLRVWDQADQVKREHNELVGLGLSLGESETLSTVTAPDWFVTSPNC